MRRIRLVIISLLLVFMASITLLPAYAGNATVSTCDFASLQTAVATANAGGGTIDFSCSGTIIFASVLTISNTVTINGGGTIVLDGNDATNLFFVDIGQSLTLDGITLQNGLANDGGAIYNYEGTLTISNSTLANNNASNYGGAIYNRSGTLTISNSTLSGNSVTAPGAGGGAILSIGTLTITNTTLSGNSGYYGGAISSFGVGSITDSMIINNNGSDGGAIDNGNLSVLTITNTTLSNNTAISSGGAIANTGTVNIITSPLSNNNADYGGVIYNRNDGVVTITDSTVLGNSVTLYGGVIYSSDTTMVTITNSTLSGNSATYGGVLANEGASVVTITDSTLSANTATSAGAIYNTMGNVTISNSTLSGNSITGAYVSGGAIVNSGTFTITNSTLSNNSSAYSGGAVDNSGTFTITNSAFFGNTAVYGGTITTGGSMTIGNSTFYNNIATAYGGVVYNNTGTVTMSDSTLVDNVATGGSGAVYNTSTMTISTSIIAGTGTQCSESFGTLTVDATNLTNTGCGSATVVTDLMLGSFNGRVIPLMVGSPAVDAYSVACASATDQLGTNRPQGSGCDIGAQELMRVSVATCDFASLVSALALVNVDGGMIDLVCSGTIAFPNELVANAHVTINGGGDVTFDGGNNTRFFTVNSEQSLGLTGLIIQNGTQTHGGAIYNSGYLTINTSRLTNNTATSSGGAIYNADGVGTGVTITNSTLSGNMATLLGGAIRNFDGIISITNSTLANNSASTIGGGISMSGNGSMTIVSSTFVNNTSPDGGAIYIAGGTTTVSASIISGMGAQCAILGGVLTADVTTITDNVCDNALVVENLMLSAFNGQIVPILTGSPAINAYSAPCVVGSDQIGTSRPQLGACDSGAVESLSVTFNEQALFAQLQIESLALGAVSYPLVLDIIPTGMTITFSDNTGAIGTAQMSLILENGLLQVIITETTGTFGTAIMSELPQMLMASFDALMAQADFANAPIFNLTITETAVIFDIVPQA